MRIVNSLNHIYIYILFLMWIEKENKSLGVQEENSLLTHTHAHIVKNGFFIHLATIRDDFSNDCLFQ